MVTQSSRFVEDVCGRKELSNARKQIATWLEFGMLMVMDPVIHIHFYANLRTITKQTDLDIPLASAKTLRELLDRLIALFPGMKHNLLDEHGDLRQDVPIFVNGRNPRLAREGIHLPLEPGDVISLFSSISSGRMNVEVMRKPLSEKQE